MERVILPAMTAALTARALAVSERFRVPRVVSGDPSVEESFGSGKISSAKATSSTRWMEMSTLDKVVQSYETSSFIVRG